MSSFFGYEISFCNVYQLKNMLSNSIVKAFYMDFVALSIPFPITICIFLKRKYPRLYIQFCDSALLTCSALFPSFDCKWHEIPTKPDINWKPQRRPTCHYNFSAEKSKFRAIGTHMAYLIHGRICW